jgi:hypothetical protein
MGRGGLVPHILVGIFFKGTPKKKIAVQTKGGRGIFPTSLYGQSAPEYG